MTDIATAKALKAFETAGREAAEQLDLSGLGLRLLPPELFTASGLKALDLSGNRLRELPEEISALSQLERLDLGGNRLDALPPGIGRLERLRELDASDNRLAVLPTQLAGCRLLERVELGSNQLTDISALASHDRLALLDLSGNQLTAVPMLACADALATLDLADNSLEKLPDGIAAFSMLRRLDLSGNRLTHVAALAGLGLFEVYLDGNALTEPPLAVAALPGLWRFSASRNPFGAMPESRAGAGAVPGTASQTTAIAASMRELAVSEELPDHLNATAPELLLAFSVLVSGLSAARLSIDLYFKRLRHYSVTLKLADGTQLALQNLNRKAAMSLLHRHQEAAEARHARLSFSSINLDRLADFSAELLARADSIDVVPDDPNRPIVQFTYIGELRMGDTYNFGDIHNSILNIKSMLSNAVQTVNGSAADPAVKAQLTDLVTRFGSALEQLPPEHVEQAEAAATTAQTLVTQALKEKPNRTLVQSTIAVFRTLTEKLGAVVPLATEIIKLVNNIIGV